MAHARECQLFSRQSCVHERLNELEDADEVEMQLVEAEAQLNDDEGGMQEHNRQNAPDNDREHQPRKLHVSLFLNQLAMLDLTPMLQSLN